MQKTVLVIDPDRSRLSEITTAWHNLPWRTITVPTLEEAIDILNDTIVDMVIVPEELSWLSGSEFLRLTHHRYPGMIRVLINEDALSVKKPEEPADFHAESRIHFTTSQPCDSECMIHAVYELFGLEPAMTGS